MALRRRQYEVENALEHASSSSSSAGSEQERFILGEDLKVIKSLVRRKIDAHNQQFHSVWGQLFKAGFQESRFAQQVRQPYCSTEE
jgi:hypothetical protein